MLNFILFVASDMVQIVLNPESRLAGQAAENAAIAAHYSEIAAQNAEASAWIGVANYISIEDGKKRLYN